jgi:hypothetical protein
VQEQQQPDPQSLDFAFLKMARRRVIREWISMIFTGVVVTAMVLTFYRILAD